MKLHGMAKSFASQLSSATAQGLAFEDRFGMIVDDEITDRENRRLQLLLRGAKLKINAHLEALDRSAKRKLDWELITNLGSCQWVQRGINLVISGKCGTGKSWLSCALAHRACVHGYSAQYHRLNLLLQDLVQARHDGSFRKRLVLLTRYSLLILDDLGVSERLTPTECEIMLELLDSRTPGRSTLVTSQLPLDRWYDYLSVSNRTTADALLDRLISNSIKLELDGDSLRPKYAAKLE
ncbi:IS21-like element helper ATPase IstB [uncultured Nevskia sp.]|uniref:IS21-like element helper ATPase IstB n=1 Tax=uncultured Nevskia sp. TaxID=228950 RepID=UPI0025E80801|nr:IS21-like element helper ATPase IstB [uncultured Nevskia sp.]